MSFTNINKNSSTINKWQELNEEFYLFPSTEAENKYRDDVNTFTNFKEDVEQYFPNFNGVIGRAFYMDDQLQSLNIDIPIQFYGNSEAIGFTQYVAGLIMERFPYIHCNTGIDYFGKWTRSINCPRSKSRRANRPYLSVKK